MTRSCGPPFLRPAGSRGRPPWWPDDEPWPPRGPAAAEAWHRMRGRFLRRAIVFVILVVLLIQWGTMMILRLSGAPGVHVGPGRFIMPLVPALLILVLVMRFAGPRVFGRMAAPVEDVMAALGRASAGDLSVRVPESGSPEARTLARAFNTMAERLQRQDEQRRNLFTDISHELRTPLAVLQGTLEGMLDGVYPRDDERLALGVEETKTLARLIEDLRTLATAESAALPLARAPADLASLAKDALAAFEGQAASAGVTLSLDAAPGLPEAEVDAERIRQVLTNLLSNALRYTPRGGAVRIRLQVPEPEHVRIAVEDTGAGITPDALEHIFDRFYKSTDSRGSGLGLAIAQSLVEAHGGTISAQSELGRGTVIRIVLPVA